MAVGGEKQPLIKALCVHLNKRVNPLSDAPEYPSATLFNRPSSQPIAGNHINSLSQVNRCPSFATMLCVMLIDNYKDNLGL